MISPSQREAISFSLQFHFCKKTKMFTNFFGKESGSLFQKQLLILWRTILFSIEGSFHRYRGPPPSRREAFAMIVSLAFAKRFTNSFQKPIFVPHKKSKSTDSPTSHLIGWRATFEPSSGRRGDRDSGGRSPRYFRLALAIKRGLCACTRRLLPSNAAYGI